MKRPKPTNQPTMEPFACEAITKFTFIQSDRLSVRVLLKDTWQGGNVSPPYET